MAYSGWGILGNIWWIKGVEILVEKMWKKVGLSMVMLICAKLRADLVEKQR